MSIIEQQATLYAAQIEEAAKRIIEAAEGMGFVVRIEPVSDRVAPAMGAYSMKVQVYPGKKLRNQIAQEKVLIALKAEQAAAK